MRRPFARSAGLVWRVNMHLLVAFGCGFTAWAIWPQDPQWWGFGVMAALLGVGSCMETIKAVRLMVSRRARDMALADYEAQGGRPKSSHMASKRDLARAGMLDE